MKFDPEKHHRRSIRLKGYDYSQSGAYFITITTQDRECLFGNIIQGEMILSVQGQMIEKVWSEMSIHYPGIETDRFVVMPNHIHGIIILNVGVSPCARPNNREEEQIQEPIPTMSLPDVIQRFKSLTTARYREGVLLHQWEPFKGRLWQRNYYEHVIRDEESLNKIREYILNNPLNWEMDEENVWRK